MVSGLGSLGMALVCFYFTWVWVTGLNIGGLLPFSLSNLLYTATHFQRLYTSLTFLSALIFFTNLSASIFGLIPKSYSDPDLPYIFIVASVLVVMAIFGGAPYVFIIVGVLVIMAIFGGAIDN